MKNATDIFDPRSVRFLLENEECIIVGTSGGPDSMALLAGLVEIRRKQSFPLVAVYVDHLMRGSAVHFEAELVRKYCENADILFRRETIKESVRGYSEEFFRTERYRVFKNYCQIYQTNLLALGHNENDLAETFLFHLGRGAAGNGMQFHWLKHHNDFRVLRPLWKTSRATILDFLKSRGIQYSVDETNESLRFTRNAIRQIIIPAMEEHINPCSRKAIVRFAESHERLYNYLAKRVGEILTSLEKDNGSLRFVERGQVSDLEEAEQFELVFRWLKSFIKSDLINERLIRAIIQWADTGKQDVIQAAQNTAVILLNNSMWIYDGKVNRKKTDDLAVQHGQIFGECIPRLLSDPVLWTSENTSSYCLSAEDGKKYPVRLSSGLEKVMYIRSRKAGDKVSPGKKLKEYLIDRKIPFYLRDRVLLAENENGGLVGIFLDFAGAAKSGTIHFEKF